MNSSHATASRVYERIVVMGNGRSGPLAAFFTRLRRGDGEI